MVNLLCYSQSSISIIGCHGNSKVSYSPYELSLGEMFFFFFISFVQVNNLTLMRNSPGMLRMLNKPPTYL